MKLTQQLSAKWESHAHKGSDSTHLSPATFENFRCSSNAGLWVALVKRLDSSCRLHPLVGLRVPESSLVPLPLRWRFQRSASHCPWQLREIVASNEKAGIRSQVKPGCQAMCPNCGKMLRQLAGNNGSRTAAQKNVEQ